MQTRDDLHACLLDYLMGGVTTAGLVKGELRLISEDGCSPARRTKLSSSSCEGMRGVICPPEICVWCLGPGWCLEGLSLQLYLARLLRRRGGTGAIERRSDNGPSGIKTFFGLAFEIGLGFGRVGFFQFASKSEKNRN